MKKLPVSHGCIICGRYNPIGLKLQFESDGEQVWARARPGNNFQGFNGVLHGGMIASLLDDALWYACFDKGFSTFTAELTVRYHKVIDPETEVRVRGWCEGHAGRVIRAAGEILDDAGLVLASAQGKFLEIPADRLDAVQARMIME